MMDKAALERALKEVRQGLLDALSKVGKDFLDKHEGAKEIVEDRLRRLAELGVELGRATLKGEPLEGIRADIDRVKNTAALELDAVALDAETEARKLFKHAATLAFEAILEVAPKLIALA